MKKHGAIWSGVVAVAAIIAAAGWYLHGHSIAVLQPAGEIGTKERNLIIFCAALSVTIVVPVFSMLIFFAWKYREGNTKAKYEPELAGNWKAETVWWAFPGILLAIISVVTWRSSYALDPFKPIDTTKKTLHIQVIAMDWKWLFIYPDEHVARVNVVDIPVGTPVEFDITSDTVMTSFWAPQLGGQMYAMPGMTTKLNLVADKAGDYNGVAANISGKGFADMKFTVHALPPEIYDDWTQIMHRLPNHLTTAEYAKLSKPGTVTDTSERSSAYSTVEPGLYDNVVMKYMMPMGGAE